MGSVATSPCVVSSGIRFFPAVTGCERVRTGCRSRRLRFRYPLGTSEWLREIWCEEMPTAWSLCRPSMRMTFSMQPKRLPVLRTLFESSLAAAPGWIRLGRVMGTTRSRREQATNERLAFLIPKRNARGCPRDVGYRATYIGSPARDGHAARGSRTYRRPAIGDQTYFRLVCARGSGIYRSLSTERQPVDPPRTERCASRGHSRGVHEWFL